MEKTPSSSEVPKFARSVAVGLLIGAVAGLGAYEAKQAVDNTVETGLKNMGDATFQQITGQDRSAQTSAQLDKGIIDLQIPPIDIEHSHGDK